ncbi:MAG: hypothetical protein BWY75_00682 [bacterium ADurb.Bin425]|nr:MAG: hypothetical protein BWY75_00682 [bacterium ADurb.Bin425]
MANKRKKYSRVEQLARGLTKESTRVVNLYTEMLPCDSCAPMIEKFCEDFPLVTVNVTYSKLPLRLPKGFRK